MSSRRWGSIWLCVVTLAAVGAGLSGCSSQALPDGSGGSTTSVPGTGGYLPGVGGTGVGGFGVGGFGVGGTGVGGTGVGGSGVGGAIDSGGSCIPGHVNPDSLPGGACAAGCQSTSCVTPCTEDCCVPCGIDLSGSKTCTCPTPGFPYANCTCLPPAAIPLGLQGGPCSPQGYAGSVPAPAPAGAISLRGAPCRQLNLVCFSAESTASSERGCICLADGLMHCGSVNHWFVNNGVPTPWSP